MSIPCQARPDIYRAGSLVEGNIPNPSTAEELLETSPPEQNPHCLQWGTRALLFFMSISEQCRGQRSRSPSFMKSSCHIGCLSFINAPLKVGQFLSMADCVSKLSTYGEKSEKQLAFLVSKGQISIVLLRMQLFIAFQSWAEAWLKGCQPMPAVGFPKLLCFGWLKGCHYGVSLSGSVMVCPPTKF